MSRIKNPAGAYPLPEYAVTVTPYRPKLDCWADDLEVDARLERNGITWLRVLGGFGGRGDREDWVAEVSVISISVNDYNWNGETFGADLGSTVEEAMDAQLARELRWIPEKIEETTKELAGLYKTALALVEAQ